MAGRMAASDSDDDAIHRFHSPQRSFDNQAGARANDGTGPCTCGECDESRDGAMRGGPLAGATGGGGRRELPQHTHRHRPFNFPDDSDDSTPSEDEIEADIARHRIQRENQIHARRQGEAASWGEVAMRGAPLAVATGGGGGRDQHRPHHHRRVNVTDELRQRRLEMYPRLFDRRGEEREAQAREQNIGLDLARPLPLPPQRQVPVPPLNRQPPPLPRHLAQPQHPPARPNPPPMPEIPDVLVEQLNVIFPGFPPDFLLGTIRDILRKPAFLNNVPLVPFPQDLVMNEAVDVLSGLQPPNPPPQPQPPLPQVPHVHMPVEDIVKETLAIFGRIEPEWVRGEANRGQTLAQICDYVSEHYADVPKVSKGIKRKAGEKEDNHQFDYMALREPHIFPSHDFAYMRAGEKQLADAYPQLSMVSVREVFRAFKSNYVPAHEALRQEMEEPVWRERIANVHNMSYATDFLITPTFAQLLPIPHRIRKLKLLKQTRGQWQRHHAPPNEQLAKEMDWLKARNDPGQEPGPVATAPQDETDSANQSGLETQDLIECAICCEEKSIALFFTCVEGHPFCDTCIKRQAAEVVHGRAAGRLLCLDDDCGAAFSAGTMAVLLEPSMIRRMETQENEQVLATAGLDKLERCKWCAYAEVMEVSAEENKVFVCRNSEECGREHCRLCGEEWGEEHFGKQCRELETDGETAARKRKEEALSAAILRICHRCQLQFQKETGCNKMTCSNCKATSCYLCKTPNIDYSHFCQHVRDPDGPPGCQQCNRCSLWEHHKDIDNRRLKEAEQAVAKAAAVTPDS